MNKWKVEFKDSGRADEIVAADSLVTEDDGSIGFFIEKNSGLILVERFGYDTWKQVTKG